MGSLPSPASSTAWRGSGAPLGGEVPPELAEPFLRLAGALLSLEEGAGVDPLFARAAPPNRPPVPFNVAHARAQAAVAMDALMRAGYRREDAAREAAKLLRRSPLLADAEGEPWRVVARWRDEMRAAGAKRKTDDKTNEEIAAGFYRDATREIADRIAAGEWDRARVEEFARAQCRALEEFR